MSTLELPRVSKPVVYLAVVALGVGFYRASVFDGRSVWLAPLAFLISGFLADLFTAVAHFGFDYVFPENMPILGPVAREFREHHDCPTLDPSNYAENLTKGSYCSLPLSIVVCILTAAMSGGPGSFLLVATLLGMSLWAFFFHQIHSYAHMGSCLPPEQFKRRVEEISRLTNQAEQIREFEKLFDAVPIPPAIRVLQRLRIILNPKTHNLHHISFVSDFSSVNGWSDPVINLALRPLARRFKAKARAMPG